MAKIDGIDAHDVECEKKIFDNYKAINNRGVCKNCKKRNIGNIKNGGLSVSLYIVG